MKIPEIQTLKKIRDAKICAMYLSCRPKQEIADKFKICLRTIDRILYKNSTVLKKSLELTKDEEKVKRIMFLKNQILMSKKYDVDLEFSPLTLNEELKKELEGDNTSVKVGDTHIIIIRPDANKEINGNQAITISRPIPIQQ